MPQLRKAEEKQVILPSFEDLPENEQAWVKVKTRVQMSDFAQVDRTKGEVMATAQVMASKIIDWNLEGEDGQKLPITAENVALLEAVDFGYISLVLGLDKLSRLNAEKKIF